MDMNQRADLKSLFHRLPRNMKLEYFLHSTHYTSFLHTILYSVFLSHWHNNTLISIWKLLLSLNIKLLYCIILFVSFLFVYFVLQYMYLGPDMYYSTQVSYPNSTQNNNPQTKYQYNFLFILCQNGSILLWEQSDYYSYNL